MSLKSSLRRFHSKMAPGGIADHKTKKERARKDKKISEVEAFYLDRRNKKISQKTPAGFDSSLFQLSALPGKEKSGEDRGAAIRKSALFAANPKLRQAIGSGNIFAYNDTIANLRTMLSRTTGGPKPVAEMPDPEEIRRQSRLKRRPMGSREQTLGLSY